MTSELYAPILQDKYRYLLEDSVSQANAFNRGRFAKVSRIRFLNERYWQHQQYHEGLFLGYNNEPVPTIFVYDLDNAPRGQYVAPFLESRIPHRCVAHKTMLTRKIAAVICGRG